ncbi:MAG: hypothetical protein EOO45_00360 [Flavobacterium sp.]|nr:MAG: hypothetical protein EOO45_00360 [Flavobacterium sp.]
MLKAGALYFSIVVAFFIAVFCASLIMLAAHYRNGYIKELRMIRLVNNLESAQARVLAAELGNGYGSDETDLYGDGLDSVLIIRKAWGVFDLAVVKSFVSSDTLKRSFLIGMDKSLDSVALYLSDEDRPLSVSGDTQITGDVEVPKSGMRKSYAEGRAYSRDDMVDGKIRDSGRKLKPLANVYKAGLNMELEKSSTLLRQLPDHDLHVSFLDSVSRFRIRPDQVLNHSFSGQIALYADSSVVLSSTCRLDGVLLFAQSIHIEAGFKGNVQLFARDSITIGDDVTLDYPSVMGLMAKQTVVGQGKISAGKGLRFSGMLFAVMDGKSSLPLMTSFGESNTISGEVYADGVVKMNKGFVLNGKVSCNRFLMQTKVSLYENFLIDVVFNRRARSGYFLSSGIFTDKPGKSKVLKWLD